MNSRDAIKVGLDMAEFVSLGYLDDLTEAEPRLQTLQRERMLQLLESVRNARAE